MPQWLNEVSEKSGFFMPHGHCYFWIPSLLWLHVISDLLIGVAYVGISLILALLVRKIRLPFSPIFVAFGLFIGLCGLTHFMAVWTVWNPDYWLSGLVKAATAAASVATAVGLFFIKPQVEALVHTARLSEERRIQLESTNAELGALYQKIKEQNEIKSQFFANVSHELRTPLALILGPAERLLGDSSLSDEHRRQIQNISRNSKSLLKQVNDLLDVAKLEEGKMQVQASRLDLVPLFEHATSQFEIAAEQRQIRFHVASPKHLEVEVDPDMIERVLVNLLSNAFKFTPAQGEIKVELYISGDEFCIAVADTGPGVDVEYQQTIFERFRQADGSTTRKYGGTGLGLAIAKDFVDLHGGQIELSSRSGRGAHFLVRMPLRAPAWINVTEGSHQPEETTRAALYSAVDELIAQPPAAASSAGPLKPTEGEQPDRADKAIVLVVEDTREMSDLITSTLATEYHVVRAFDGQEGLETALALQPDLVITDLMMPRVGGDQLVAALRQYEQFNSMPILLLTAKADDAMRVKLLETGAQDYLTKPFLPQELLARVGNLISVKRAGDALRLELTSVSGDVESLANELAVKHNQLQVAFDATEVAREQAERLSQVKSHFLAMISHELRTPLSTIIMSAQLLGRQAEGHVSEVGKSRLERMVRATQQLSNLVEGIIEYTRVEGGKVTARARLVDPAEIAKEVVDVAQTQVASPEVALSLAPPPEDLPPLVTDPRLLRMILNNLIANALKFTHSGRITLSLAHQEQWHIFEVHDTGIGIPTADIGRIFLPFEQLEPIQRKSIPGVGLGLSLTKEIVEGLGGRIEVTSEEGIGSTFRVWLRSHSTTPE